MIIRVHALFHRKLITLLPIFAIIVPVIPKLGNLMNQTYYFLILELAIIELITNIRKNKRILFFVSFIVFLFIYAIITYPFLGINNDMFITVMKWILSGTAITLGMGVMIDESNIKSFMSVFTFTSILTLIVAIVEMYTGWHIVETVFSLRKNNLNNNFSTAFFGNVNDLANYVVICLTFCMFYFKTEWNKMSSIFYCIVTLYVIINTESYLSYLSLIVLLTITIITKLKYDARLRIKLGKLLKIIVQWAIILSILCTLVYLLKDKLDDTFYNIIKEVINRINKLFLTTKNDDYANGRIIILEHSYKDFINSSIFFGCGIGYTTNTYGTPMHNLFATMLFDFGLIVFIYFMCILIIMYARLINIIKYTDIKSKWFNKKFAIVTICQLVTLPITSTIPSEALQRKMIWFIFGFILICIKNIPYYRKQYDWNYIDYDKGITR